ncbi:Uma2 family endonuclease [Enhygromyxa salina]|uniref:Uma2 family endonuclease n=1 Tax=Enhygromyxa salina TaxID=215803 RepID=UPI001FD08817|nr:Uma2 family endonuclease [Enhygromyxa salina]
MTAEAATQRMSYADYAELERQGLGKHEYLRGEVVAMTDGTLEHARLASQLAYLLGRELAGGSCRVFSSDLRVRIEATDLDTYPDLSVVCGDPQTAAADDHALLNPTLVIEVLSKSTEGYDRGQKASHYRRIPALKGYLLVSQQTRQLELQTRRDDGSWTLLEAGPGEQLCIEALGVTLDVDEVYQGSLGPQV